MQIRYVGSKYILIFKVYSEMKFVTVLLTGHCMLRWHLHIMDLSTTGNVAAGGILLSYTASLRTLGWKHIRNLHLCMARAGKY